MKTDTIFALASGAMPSAIAIVRVSGPGASAALQRLTGGPPGPARKAIRSRIEDPRTGEVLDDGLVLWFPGPASFTGEDLVEFQLHGGRAVVAGVLAALAECEGLRPAEAGEFARRAFHNGKLDLTAVEGLADLIGAETAAQRRQALRVAEGELGRLYDSWRERLLRAQAHLEAMIDFSDEDLPEGLLGKVRVIVAETNREIGTHLDDGRRGELIREGLRIAIIGPPNAGKSSLLNLLARRDAAIVSERAGTTRDVIEVHLDLGGMPVIVADTAGLRDSPDEIEQEGIRRARQHAENADLRLALFSAETWPDLDEPTQALCGEGTIRLLNKADLLGAGSDRIKGEALLPISVQGGAGIDRLMDRLETEVRARCGGGESLGVTRLRHRVALERCRLALGRFGQTEAIDLAAEELRSAAQALGGITGRVGVEGLLDRIFHDFCIGK